MIFETVIYDGRLKEFRIFNITTGSVYSGHYDTEKQAYDDIEDGVDRAGQIVRRVRRDEILDLLLKEVVHNWPSNDPSF